MKGLKEIASSFQGVPAISTSVGGEQQTVTTEAGQEVASQKGETEQEQSDPAGGPKVGLFGQTIVSGLLQVTKELGAEGSSTGGAGGDTQT